MTRSTKWWVGSGGACLLFALASAWILTSDAFLRWLVAMPIVQENATISPADVRGDLLGPISVERVGVPAAGLEATSVDFQHRLWPLLRGRVSIERITIGRVVVDPPTEPSTSVKSSASFSLPELPVDIEIVSGRIGSLQVLGLPDPLSKPQVVEVQGLRYDASAVTLQAGSVAGAEFRASVGGNLPLAPAAGEALSVQIELSIEASDDPRIEGSELSIEAQGALPEVGVRANLLGPGQVELSGNVSVARDELDVDMALRFAEIRPEVLDQPQLAGLAGALNLKGDLENFRVDGSIELPELLAYPLLVDASGTWVDPRLELTRFELSADAATINGEGSFVAQIKPEVAATVDWERLDTIIDTGGVVLTRGWADLRGNTDSLALRGSADVEPLPEVALATTFAGTLTPTELALEQITIDGDVGEFSGQARFGFSARRGEINGALRDVNPGAIWPEYSGSLAAGANVGIVLDEAACSSCTRITAALSTLSGDLRQLSAGGQVTALVDVAGGAVTGLATAGGLQWGNSRAVFDMNGSDANLEGTWSLVVPDLEQHTPAAGSLEASGVLVGSLVNPGSQTELDLKNLRAEGAALDSLKAAGRIDLSGNLPTDLTMSASGVSVAGTNLERLVLQIVGTSTDNTRAVSVTANNDFFTAQAQAEVEREAAGWKGLLRSLTANVTDREPIALEAPAKFSVADAGTGELAAACLSGADLRTCVAGTRDTDAATLDLEVTRLDLSLLTALGLLTVPIEGDVAGEARLIAGAPGQVSGSGAFELGPGRIGELGPGADREPLLAWRGANIDVDSDRNRLILSAAADLPNADSLELELAFSGQKLQTLDGRIAGQLSQWGLISAALPQVSAAEGSLALDLGILGTVASPQLAGAITVADGALSLPDLGVRWTELNAEGTLAWSSVAPTLSFSGTGRSGDGTFRAEGAFEKFAPLIGEINVMGEGFLLADRPEARLVANADLELAVAEPVLEVRGRVEIPTGELKAAPVSVVEASADERVIGVVEEDFKTTEWLTRGVVELGLGDDLSVDASGLKAMLGGELTIRLQPEQNITGRGEIQLSDATYEAFRQTLEIERGNLQFNGGSIDNPALDFSAVRKIDEQTVGFQVRGVLKDPQLNLFSDPALSRAETLSYLTLGRSLSAASEGEQQILGDAAASAAIGSGNFVAEELGRRLGVEGRLEGNLDNASLVLGKYLSPKLYVSYGIGLFAAVDTLRLRYQLNRRLALQAESGQEQGADLIYTVEK